MTARQIIGVSMLAVPYFYAAWHAYRTGFLKAFLEGSFIGLSGGALLAVAGYLIHGE